MKAFISALTVALSVFSTFAANQTVLSEDLIGAWSYSVDTPEGTYEGQLVFSKGEDGLTGKMIGRTGETTLKDIVVENNDVRFSLYVEGYLVKVKGKVNGDSFEGKVEVDYEYYTIKAQKVEAASLGGVWDFRADTPEGPYTGQFIFAKKGDQYTGKMIMQGNTTELKELKVEADKVSFSLYTQGYYVTVKGTLEGPILDARATIDSESFPVKAQKAK